MAHEAETTFWLTDPLPVFEGLLELLFSMRLFSVDKLIKKENSTRHFSFVLFAENSSSMSLLRVTSSTDFMNFKHGANVLT